MGHRTLQKDRLERMAKNITSIKMPNRAILVILKAPPVPMTSAGMETWIVAAGQIRQKDRDVCSPRIKGIIKTMRIKTTYLICDVHAGRLIFFEGILYRRSWRNPNGQIQPQKSLPKIIPMNSTVPRARNGKILYPEKYTKTPMGQANQDKGHE
jgi:hypothetical protein